MTTGYCLPSVCERGILKLPRFRLTGGGGSGQYTWLSRDMPHVGVNQEGVVTGRKEGSVGVTASDAKNPDNSATSQVKWKLQARG